MSNIFENLPASCSAAGSNSRKTGNIDSHSSPLSSRCRQGYHHKTILSSKTTKYLNTLELFSSLILDTESENLLESCKDGTKLMTVDFIDVKLPRLKETSGAVFQ